ncbi:cysteine synthase A [Peptococcus simiae]|uniref:Cysteine synthase n=1 Tax=Peptococcus simiae TaxID=1643805 RepID=A0ABW9H1I8_9FIRM
MFKSVTDMIGHTPMIALTALTKALALDGTILAKAEFLNPTGSMKDRIALAMIRGAEAAGQLKVGGTIIEPTSGNTGIGLAAVGARLGYKVVIVMPETMSIERRKMMAVYGADLVLTPGAEGMKGAIAKAEALQKELDGAIIAGQFANPLNPEIHYKTTGPEVWEALEEARIKPDILVAGVGTGGSLSGVGKYLKERQENLKVVAVEPARSAVLSGQPSGTHRIQGIGAGFVPDALDRSVIDDIYQATDEDALAMVGLLARTEGLFAGVSSGAALTACRDILRKEPGQTLVTLLPDSGNRYISMGDIFDQGKGVEE